MSKGWLNLWQMLDHRRLTKRRTKNRETEENIKTEMPFVKGGEDMTEMAKEELIARIEALDREEMELVARRLPAEICWNRIKEELEEAARFRKHIFNAIIDNKEDN